MKIPLQKLNQWLKRRLQNVKVLLNKVDGNKTLVGFVYFTFQHYLPISIYFDILTTIMALWTGYGVIDKLRKHKKK